MLASMKKNEIGTRQKSTRGPLPWLLASLALAVSGCKHAPPPPKIPLAARITISAAADANPDPTGRASPVVIRIYRLRSGDAFNGASMEPLYFKDREVLAADLVARDEWELRPGESRDVQWDLTADVHVIGVMAALRDYHSVPWRISVTVPSAGQSKGAHVLVIAAQVSSAGLVLGSSAVKDK
jgi:type VI secretion system protein VasD